MNQKFLLHFEDENEIVEITGECFGKTIEQNFLLEGDLVFTTGMTGILESLTDPSFSDQILIFSFPPFGNYGAPRDRTDYHNLSKDFESMSVSPLAVICDHQINEYSHWNAEKSLDDYLNDWGVFGIKNVDTRL